MVNTKEIILKTSQSLFGRFGLKKTTVDEIARLAHVGKGTIYHYFDTKEKIFAEIIEKETRYLSQKLSEAVQQEKTPQDKLQTYVLTRLIVLKELVNYYSALRDEYLAQYSFIEKARKESLKAELNMVKSILEEGIALKVFAINDIDLTAFAIVTALKGLEYPWTIETTTMSLSDIKKKVHALLVVLFKGIEIR
jgi:AcrR family transcriptional regulator